MLGETGVGKSNIINRMIDLCYNELLETTLGSSYSQKTISLENKEYLLHIWDSNGHASQRRLTRLFYNNSKIIIFVYDITSKESFNELNEQLKDAEDKIGSDFVRGIIANKKDLYENEKVTEKEGEAYAKSINAKFLMFSAKCDNEKKLEDFLSKLLKEYLNKEENKKRKKSD